MTETTGEPTASAATGMPGAEGAAVGGTASPTTSAAAGSASGAAASDRLPVGAHPADTPISLWPEGVLAVAAGFTLLVIGLRHRYYLQRKAREVQRVVDEFQRQGGMEELRQVARQASEFFGRPS